MAIPGEARGGHETLSIEDQVLEVFEKTQRIVSESYGMDTEEDLVRVTDFHELFSDIEYEQLVALLQGNTPHESVELLTALKAVDSWATVQKNEKILKLAKQAFIEAQNRKTMELIGGKSIKAISRQIRFEPGIQQMIGGENGRVEVSGIVKAVQADLGAIIVEEKHAIEDESALYWVNTFSLTSLFADKDNLVTDFQITS
jgi:hypothetical protein